MNYYGVWKTFNKFFTHLDIKPNNWEDRLTLFIAYLIETKKESSTIKSYVSAIKAVLLDIKVELNGDRVLLAALTKACKIKNDQIKAKLPIKSWFLKHSLNMAFRIGSLIFTISFLYLQALVNAESRNRSSFRNILTSANTPFNADTYVLIVWDCLFWSMRCPTNDVSGFLSSLKKNSLNFFHIL